MFDADVTLQSCGSEPHAYRLLFRRARRRARQSSPALSAGFGVPGSNVRPWRRPLQDLARREHVGVAASAATKPP